MSAVAALVAAFSGRHVVGRAFETRNRATLSMVTANVLVSNKDVGSLFAQVLDRRSDVSLFQEVTPEHAEALETVLAGHPEIDSRINPRRDYAGAAIVSRLPIVESGCIEFGSWPLMWAEIDHAGTLARWVNVHCAAPQPSEEHRIWREQLRFLSGLATAKQPIVLAGDFNATSDHRDFRELLAAGFVDAYAAVGAGRGATWPSVHGMPGLMRLDHVLVNRHLMPHSVGTIRLPGSDHRGLQAEANLMLPCAAAPSQRAGRVGVGQ